MAPAVSRDAAPSHFAGGHDRTGPVEWRPPSLATPLPAISLAVTNGRALLNGARRLATPLPAISLAVTNGRALRSAARTLALLRVRLGGTLFPN